MEEMNITAVRYASDLDGSNLTTTLIATIDSVEYSIPATSGNRHYDEIMRQVEAGTLTIADAD